MSGLKDRHLVAGATVTGVLVRRSRSRAGTGCAADRAAAGATSVELGPTVPRDRG